MTIYDVMRALNEPENKHSIFTARAGVTIEPRGKPIDAVIERDPKIIAGYIVVDGDWNGIVAEQTFRVSGTNEISLKTIRGPADVVVLQAGGNTFSVPRNGWKKVVK